MPTNVFTEVTIGDSAYSIKKFDARTALKIARLVIAKAASLIPIIDGTESLGNERIYSAVSSIFESLGDADIDNLIDKCLRVCYVNLPAGLQPVIDETGNYGVEGIEYDTSLTIQLCVEAIKWGASDFFGGKNSALSQLMKQAGLSQNR